MSERKVSEIQLSDICSHINEIEDELTEEERTKKKKIELPAAISFCKNHTGLSLKEIDEKEDITIAVLALIADMWDNRSYTTSFNDLNPVVDGILSMHANNLLPSEVM